MTERASGVNGAVKRLVCSFSVGNENNWRCWRSHINFNIAYSCMYCMGTCKQL